MKNLKCLAIWAAVLLVANLAISTAAQAHCKGKHGDDPDCATHNHDSGGQDGKNDRNLEASFCMNFADVVPSDSYLSLSTDAPASHQAS